MEGIRTIGPKALDAYVGDRIMVDIHIGHGTYYRQIGTFAEDGTDFYVKDPFVVINGERVSQLEKVVVKHGDVIHLQKNSRVVDYLFIDESD